MALNFYRHLRWRLLRRQHGGICASRLINSPSIRSAYLLCNLLIGLIVEVCGCSMWVVCFVRCGSAIMLSNDSYPGLVEIRSNHSRIAFSTCYFIGKRKSSISNAGFAVESVGLLGGRSSDHGLPTEFASKSALYSHGWRKSSYEHILLRLSQDNGTIECAGTSLSTSNKLCHCRSRRCYTFPLLHWCSTGQEDQVRRP